MRTPRRFPLVAGIVLSLMAWLVVAPAPTGAATAAKHRSDKASAGGYDWHTLMDADVIAGTPGNVVIRYVAGRAVTNGVLRIVVPTRAWPTPLYAEEALYENKPPGAFSVRPALATPEGLLPETTRPEGSTCAPVAAGSWSVSQLRRAQVITVRNVTCAAGQELSIRMEGVQAPNRPRTYAFVLVMKSPGSPARTSVAKVRVVPEPQTQLVVTVPQEAQAGVPFDVIVFAIGPDGLPDADYRGAVSIWDPADCTLTPRGRGVAHQFTADDGGHTRISTTLSIIATHQLHVYDIGRKAIEGVSAPFDIVPPPPDSIICPVSYH